MIPRELFDRYDRALSASARMALEAIVSEAGALAGMDPERLRAAYVAIVGRYGRLAEAAALEMYQELRDGCSPPTEYEAVLPEISDADALVGDVLRLFVAGGDPSVSVAGLSRAARRRVMERADATLVSNARADPAHPRWALVPHAGACPWCRFLGSQGFVYRSEDTALASRHDDCMCTPVVDFDVGDPRLDGYDPDVLRGEYLEARARVESDARSEWESMSAEERDAYRAKGRGAYDHFLRNRIVAAMGGEES